MGRETEREEYQLKQKKEKKWESGKKMCLNRRTEMEHERCSGMSNKREENGTGELF